MYIWRGGYTLEYSHNVSLPDFHYSAEVRTQGKGHICWIAKYMDVHLKFFFVYSIGYLILYSFNPRMKSVSEIT